MNESPHQITKKDGEETGKKALQESPKENSAKEVEAEKKKSESEVESPEEDESPV